MAAETTVALKDGFSTIIKLTGADVTFWEKAVTPPGLDGGEPIDITTMRNISVRTKSARDLYDVTPAALNVAYDPTVYDSIIAAININQSIVITFPDGGTLTWYGYLQKFTPEALEEGKQPMAAISLVPTNITDDVETIPVMVAGSGTN